MNKKDKVFKILFSLTFFTLAFLIVMFDWAREKIDYYVVGVILIGFIPWIVRYIKSFELSGMKLELFNADEIKKIEQNINIIKDETIKNVQLKMDKIDDNLKNEIESRSILKQSIDLSDVEDIGSRILMWLFEIDYVTNGLICHSKIIVSEEDKLLKKLKMLGKNNIIPMNLSNSIIEVLKKIDIAFDSEQKKKATERDLKYIDDFLSFYLDMLCNFELLVYLKSLSNNVMNIPNKNDRIKIIDRIIG